MLIKRVLQPAYTKYVSSYFLCVPFNHKNVFFLFTVGHCHATSTLNICLLVSDKANIYCMSIYSYSFWIFMLLFSPLQLADQMQMK